MAHRLQKRQAADGVGDDFISNTYGLGGHKVPGLLRIRREVKIGVKDLVRFQHGAFERLRFLDLDDHFRLTEHLGGAVGDIGAGIAVGSVARPNAATGIGLD